MKRIQFPLLSFFVLASIYFCTNTAFAANSWSCSNASCSIRGSSCPTAGQTTACPSPTGSSCTCQTLSANATWSVTTGSGNYSCSSSKACPSGPCNTSTDSPYGCGSCTGGVYAQYAQCGSGGGGGGGGGTAGKCGSLNGGVMPSPQPASGSSVWCSQGGGMIKLTDKGTYWQWVCTGTGTAIGVFCQADKAPSITCGSADKKTYPTSGPPSADRCVNTTQTNFAFRYSGPYWNGWTWNCGTASCSANLSPGICGDANKTTRSTAPSTAKDLCLAGVASSVSGSGPWTWSCTGTACSASKTASCTPSCSLNPASYCTTQYLGGDGCGGSCGYGTMVCPTPRLKVCPATVTLNPTQTQQLEARYWADRASIPTCSTTGYSMVTSSAAWSSSVPSVATVSNTGTKGVVTAGSPASTSLANIQALYSGLSSFSSVTVNGAAASPSATISGSGCAISEGSSTCDGTFTWAISGATSPSVFNATRSVQYTTASSGNNSPFAITYGANTVQARDGATVLAAASVSGTCASGTWDGSKCAAASLATVDLKANSSDGPIVQNNQPVNLTWSTSNVVVGSCIASGEWSGTKSENSASGENQGTLPIGVHSFTLTCRELVTNISRSDTVSVTSVNPPCSSNGCEVDTCTTKTCNNGCNPNASGTKVCDQHWKEVAP